LRGTWPGAVRDRVALASGASASWTHARALPPTQTYVAEQLSKAPGVMNVICLAERSTVPVKPGQLPLRTRGAPAHMPGTPNHCLASGACLCARLRAHRGCINAPAESPDHLQQEDRSSGELGAASPLHFSTVQGTAHLDLAQSGVVHTKPASIVQVLLHPSPLTTLPSSQASYVFNPSPHAGVQSWHAVALHVCVQQTGQCIRGSVCVCAATVNECRHLSVIAFGCVCN